MMKNCRKTSLLCVGKTPGVLPIMVGHTGKLGPKFRLQVHERLGITKRFTQESSSLSLKNTLQSGKPSNIVSQKKSAGISKAASALW